MVDANIINNKKRRTEIGADEIESIYIDDEIIQIYLKKRFIS